MCAQERGQNVSLPRDARRALGASGPWSGTDDPNGEGTQRGKERGPERIISAGHTAILCKGDPRCSEPLDIGPRRRTEEKKPELEELWQGRNGATGTLSSSIAQWLAPVLPPLHSGPWQCIYET